MGVVTTLAMIKIRIGYELLYDFPQPTPLMMVLGTHFSRASDIVVPDDLTTTPLRDDRALSRRLRQLVWPASRPSATTFMATSPSATSTLG